MADPTKKIATISLISLGISACSSMDGDWPSLADPLPSADERVRVIEPAAPNKQEIASRESNLTRSTAYKLFESSKARLLAARTDYEAAAALISKTTNSEDQLDAWNQAQLALTRYSRQLSVLDDILETETLKGTPIWTETKSFKDEEDQYLNGERTKLGARNPR